MIGNSNASQDINPSGSSSTTNLQGVPVIVPQSSGVVIIAQD